ncbi:MAG: SHOCT domain-containing protein [Desulfocapsa sp.]|nr:SHOCT domain-containing protein [Desulfocapsa sp.]
MKNMLVVLIVVGMLSGCSPYGADKQVKLPAEISQQKATITLVDLRPDSEKTRTDFSGHISVADDRQFHPNKVEYLKSELSKINGLTNSTFELISFKHTLDTRSTTGAVETGAWAGGAVGMAIGGSSAAKGKDTIQCNIVLKVNNREYTSQQVEYFTLGTIMAIEWEKPELREATRKVTIACVADLIAQIEGQGEVGSSIVTKKSLSEHGEDTVELKGKKEDVAEEKLTRLKKMYEKGIITEEEYAKERAEALEEF